jgi:hypothetical protein
MFPSLSLHILMRRSCVGTGLVWKVSGSRPTEMNVGFIFFFPPFCPRLKERLNLARMMGIPTVNQIPKQCFILVKKYIFKKNTLNLDILICPKHKMHKISCRVVGRRGEGLNICLYLSAARVFHVKICSKI